jgi:hypothetical protein
MIYVCIPCNGPKSASAVEIRQVFTVHPREYHLLVADDASTDASAEVLEPYTKVLPLTVVRQERRGYARQVDATLEAVALSDRPRPCRDSAARRFPAASRSDLVRRLEPGRT